MEQFSLEKWLQDKSRKVVTRRRNPVRIICTDRKHGEDDLPIVFLEECLNGEFLLTCRKDGRSDTYDTQYDLFFADEEEELTEFEEELLTMIKSWKDGNPLFNKSTKSLFKKDSQKFLELARKEILKDLPKWKKFSEEYRELDSHAILLEDNRVVLTEYLEKGDYYISSEDLKTLPKEE